MNRLQSFANIEINCSGLILNTLKLGKNVNFKGPCMILLIGRSIIGRYGNYKVGKYANINTSYVNLIF